MQYSITLLHLLLKMYSATHTIKWIKVIMMIKNYIHIGYVNLLIYHVNLLIYQYNKIPQTFEIE